MLIRMENRNVVNHSTRRKCLLCEKCTYVCGTENNMVKIFVAVIVAEEQHRQVRLNAEYENPKIA